MKSSEKEKQLFRYLLNRSLDGQATAEEIQQMNGLLATSPDLMEYYLRLMQIQSLLLETQVSDETYMPQGTSFDEQFWFNMAEHERTAPEIEIPHERPPRELIQKVVYPPREKRKISKFTIFTLVNVAAMILVILIVLVSDFIPYQGRVKVATIADTMDAKWNKVAGPMQKGARLDTGRKEFVLNQGLAELLFDNDTKIVIEGPAELKLLSEDQIYLGYGQIYATVPPQAIGFTVNTPTARIIDLGTEFGVSVNANGNTSLHVIKGKTMLIAGTKSAKKSIQVTECMAKKISGVTQDVSDITFHPNIFVRDINSNHKAVWRERPSLDLADMVRKGNGMGTGNSQARLNYDKGFTNEIRSGHASTSTEYLAIQDHPFIDGIFIPNGKTTVSSQDHVFENFLETSGVHCSDLYANPAPGFIQTDEQPRTIQFDEQEYSDQEKSCIIMQYSNHGITFDLEAIRKSYQTDIDQFICRVGIADFQQEASDASFYVLVDGHVRYSLLQYKQMGVLNDVVVDIENTDRFLTLATTEAVSYSGTFFDNWCVFAEPVLTLE